MRMEGPSLFESSAPAWSDPGALLDIKVYWGTGPTTAGGGGCDARVTRTGPTTDGGGGGGVAMRCESNTHRTDD